MTRKWIFHIILPVIAGILIISCRKEVMPESPIQGNSKIAFTASLPDTLQSVKSQGKGAEGRWFLGFVEKDSIFITFTRGENSRIVFPTAAGGDSYHTKGAISGDGIATLYASAFLSDGGVTYINNGTVIKEGNSWGFSPACYWPKGYALDFMAYGSNTATVAEPAYTRTADGSYSGTFSYTLPAPQTSVPQNDAQMQPDLVYASAAGKTSANNPVELQFFHALSAIRFKLGDMPDDATVLGAQFTLAGVIPQGSCTIRYPLDAKEDISWSLPDNPVKNSYTETFTPAEGEGNIAAEFSTDAGTFMMIPQEVASNSDGKLLVTLRIGEKDYKFEKAFSTFGNGHKWEPGMRYTYTISTGGYVEAEISEEVTTTVKSNVRLQNTGLITSYLRAAIVSWWESPSGQFVSGVDITNNESGTFSLGDSWNQYWTKGQDGFYYYKEPVAPGYYTAVPLFESYKLTGAGPVAGATLKIHIAAQAIAVGIADTAWPGAPVGGNGN